MSICQINLKEKTVVISALLDEAQFIATYVDSANANLRSAGQMRCSLQWSHRLSWAFVRIVGRLPVTSSILLNRLLDRKARLS